MGSTNNPKFGLIRLDNFSNSGHSITGHNETGTIPLVRDTIRLGETILIQYYFTLGNNSLYRVVENQYNTAMIQFDKVTKPLIRVTAIKTISM